MTPIPIATKPPPVLHRYDVVSTKHCTTHYYNDAAGETVRTQRERALRHTDTMFRLIRYYYCQHFFIFIFRPFSAAKRII